jgi:hypothetical protein
VAPYTYSWSGGQHTQSIANLSAGKYSIVIKDDHNCQVSDSFTIKGAIPYESAEICLVTFDPATGRNIIIWEKRPDAGIRSYNIFRESGITGEYDLTGISDFERSGYFVDETSEPDKMSYRYKISVTDTCGNESGLSASHKTMHLITTSGSEGEIHLMWEQYEGFEVQKYIIRRGTDINNMSVVDSAAGGIDSYTDLPPEPGTYFYQLEAVGPGTCNPDTAGLTFSSSFTFLPGTVPGGINNLSGMNKIEIYPNPFIGSATLKFSNPEGSRYSLCIIDLSGKVCRVVNDITTSDYVLQRRDLKQGFYFIELIGPDIYRGKIIIE